MPAETRPNLPDGFVWQEVPEMRAAFPTPKGWYYRFEEYPGTISCFITREEIQSAPRPKTSEEIRREVSEGRGYKTGLSVNVLDRISIRKGISSVTLAKRAVTSNPLLVTVREVSVLQQNPLVVHRGYFRSGSRLLASRGMPPIRHYLEATGNRRTDRTYIMLFETPEELWEQDEKIARIIIENRILDSKF